MTAIPDADLERWRTLRGSDLTAAQLAATWYPHPDDLGGWCIMPIDAPPSCGAPPVGDMLGETIARNVARVHNQHHRPVVGFTPGIQGGYPQMRGIPVESLGGMVWSGETVDVTADEYDLDRPHILTACWWLGTHGTRAWRRRWGKWAADVYSGLASDQWTVPDPPSRED